MRKAVKLFSLIPSASSSRGGIGHIPVSSSINSPNTLFLYHKTNTFAIPEISYNLYRNMLKV